MPTPARTRVRFLVDVYDICDVTGEQYLSVYAGETGTVIAAVPEGMADWPTVVLDKLSDETHVAGPGHQRVFVADMENHEEVEIIR